MTSTPKYSLQIWILCTRTCQQKNWVHWSKEFLLTEVWFSRRSKRSQWSRRSIAKVRSESIVTESYLRRRNSVHNNKRAILKLGRDRRRLICQRWLSDKSFLRQLSRNSLIRPFSLTPSREAKLRWALETPFHKNADLISTFLTEPSLYQTIREINGSKTWFQNKKSTSWFSLNSSQTSQLRCLTMMSKQKTHTR